MFDSLWPHGLQHTRLPCPSPTPRACSNSCPSSQWCHPTSSPFSSCLQSFPASGSFPISQFFTSGGKTIGSSASSSVLPMNIQDWFPLGLTDLISLLSKGLSRVFSNTTVQKHQFFGARLSLGSNSHIQFQVYSKVIQILSDSDIYIYIFSDSFPYRLLENIEHTSLCCIISPYWLSILYLVVCIC